MKIEIGESLGYSYLRHVKGCWLVQTNWKPSEHWTKCQTDKALEQEFQKMRQQFDPDGRVFKGTKDSNQFLKQAEIDVVGVGQDGGVHAMEVAFHEAGLNYLGGANVRVLKKLLRTKLVLDAYHPPDTKRDIYFVSPKVYLGVQQPLADIITRLQEAYPAEAYPAIEWHLVTNERFTSELLEPTLKKAKTVSDTTELFVRSAKLLELTENNRPSGTSLSSQRIPERSKTPIEPQRPNGKPKARGFQDIVRGLMQCVLEDYPSTLSEGLKMSLLDDSYCRDNMGLHLGGFALLRRQEEGRMVSGHSRYWSRVYAGEYYVTNNWWSQYHTQNAESLLRFVENLIERRPGFPEVDSLDAHRAALRDYLA